MHHFFEAITNTAGDSLIGYFGRVINRTTQNTVTLSSDENGTPIVVTSGVENMAKTDDYGNLGLYVEPGTYHLDIYAPNTTTFLFRVSDVAMNSSKGDTGPQGEQGEPGEGLEDVMAPTGSTLVGFIQAGSSGAVVVDTKLKQGGVTPDDFPLLANDTLKFQAALDNHRGLIELTRNYTLTGPVTMGGNVKIIGRPGAKITWNGPTTGNIIQDRSVAQLLAGQPAVTVSSNILMEGFEIDGGDFTSGDAGQVAVNFYRTSNVTFRRLIVHGVGGSLLRWGFSMADTVGILVEDCDLYDCRIGDAAQGCGRFIKIRNNRIGKPGSTTGNFGDTAIALLYDFSSTTNPTGIYTTDWEFASNTIIGNYQNGVYVGSGQSIQTGLAIGPFANGVNMNGRIVGNIIQNCYLNVWPIVGSNVLIANNDLGPHSATATGNLRVDGIANCTIINNNIALGYAATGNDCAGILLVAQRNTFGASNFDSDIVNCRVSGNTITSTVAGARGIRVTFEGIYTSPSYVSKIRASRIENNTFINVATPIDLAPLNGSTANVCDDLVISGNKCDSAATTVVNYGGNSTQYWNVRQLDNPAMLATVPWSGSGNGSIALQHKVSAMASFANGVTTTVLALPATGVCTVTVAADIPNTSETFSAVATYRVSNGTVRDISSSNGGVDPGTGPGLKITRSSRNVQVTYNIGGDVSVNVVATYS